MPCETMIFAVTMKTISNTSVTSTRGVTLMPLMMSSSSESLLAISTARPVYLPCRPDRAAVRDGPSLRILGRWRAKFRVAGAQRIVGDQVSEQHAPEGVGVGEDRFELSLKDVVHGHRRDCDEQADGR